LLANLQSDPWHALGLLGVYLYATALKLILTSPKMSKYHMHKTATTSTIIPETEVQGWPSYMSILDKYRINNMVIGIGTSNSDQNQATINQEY